MEDNETSSPFRCVAKLFLKQYEIVELLLNVLTVNVWHMRSVLCQA